MHRRVPRKLRVEYPGAIYHVMNRGNRRKGDAKKVRIAQRLRVETTMPLKWIAGGVADGALDARVKFAAQAAVEGEMRF